MKVELVDFEKRLETGSGLVGSVLLIGIYWNKKKFKFPKKWGSGAQKPNLGDLPPKGSKTRFLSYFDSK